MRRAYRDLHRTEPALRSAIDGKAAAVAALDVSVLPEDKDHPDDCTAAKFVDWTVSRSPHGWDGLILAVLRPALIDGFSLAEKVLKGVDDSRQWHGFWGLKHVKPRDTAHLQLRLDGYRNVLGVVNTVRGLRTYSPAKFIRFTHADLFDNPFGQSDLRAAYRAAGQIQDAYRLWYLALKRCGEPYLHGKYDHPAQRAEFEKALRALRAGGWAVTGPRDEIAVLDLAGAASFDAFERKVRLLREDIFLAVRGAYTPFMQSNSGAREARGNTAVSQHGGSDPVEEVLARAVGRVLTDQLVPDLVRPNFGDRVGLPRVVLGGVNWGELRTRLDILERAKKLGLSVSARWAHETLQIPPAATPDDELGGPPQGENEASGLPPAQAFAAHYDESKHPRDERGRWIEKGTLGTTRDDRPQTRISEWSQVSDSHDPFRGPTPSPHPPPHAVAGGPALRPAPATESNLMVLASQKEAWAQKFRDAGIEVRFTPPDARGYVRVVMFDVYRSRPSYEGVVGALRPTGLDQARREGGEKELQEVMNALWRTDPGKGDRYLVLDPKTEQAHVSSDPGFADHRAAVGQALDRELNAAQAKFDQLLRKDQLIKTQELPEFFFGLAQGFVDGLGGTLELAWAMLKVSPAGLLLRSQRGALNGLGRSTKQAVSGGGVGALSPGNIARNTSDALRTEFEPEAGFLSGVVDAVRPKGAEAGPDALVLDELGRYFAAAAQGQEYTPSPEARRALQYVALMATQLGIEALNLRPREKGRVLGLLAYMVAETVVLDAATAGIAEATRPARLTGAVSKLKAMGVPAAKADELATTLARMAKLEDQGRRIDRIEREVGAAGRIVGEGKTVEGLGLDTAERMAAKKAAGAAAGKAKTGETTADLAGRQAAGDGERRIVREATDPKPRAPRETGTPPGKWFEGVRREGKFRPDDDQLLAHMRRRGGQDYVEYKNGYPVFDPWRAKHKGKMMAVEIEMTGKYPADFAAARTALIKKYRLSNDQVKALEADHTWHHFEKVR